MANYSNDFNALAVASGVPTGLTSRWDAGTWAIADAAGDHYLRESSAGNNRYFVSLDAVDGDADRANGEILVPIRLSNRSSADTTYIGAVLRGSGNGSSENGYAALVVNSGTTPYLRLTKYLAGANNTIATSASAITFNVNTWYWLRFRVNGTSLQARIWADGDSEPGTWNVSATDSSISAAGWCGLFGFLGGINKDFNGVAVATNGDTAAMSAPDTLVTVANSSQANVASTAAANQTHLVGAANSNQANAATGAIAGQSNDSLVTAATSQQANTASAAAINQTHLVGISSSNQANVASGAAAGLAPVVISGDYERSSVNVAGSSVEGTGDASVVVIKPRVQESEVKSSLTAWLEPSAKITGVNGIRPTFRFSDYASTWSDGKYHGVPWGTGRRPMFSYDRLNWTYFDTQTVTGTYIEFRHNTAFTGGTVYISRERQVSVTQTGDWIAALEAAHPTKVSPPASALAFTPTLTSWPAQSYIADEYSAQTDELGAAIPATPLYAFQINDTSLMPANGAKRVAIITSGVHAGEDTGNWAMQRAVEYILGNSATAQYIRRHFRVLVYPMMNSPGRYGGGWRGSFSQGVGGADDANRHYNESGSGLEIVNKPKAIQTTDRAGAVPAFAFDWHGRFEANWGYFSGSSVLTAFGSLLSTKFGTAVDDMGALASGAQTEYWRNSVSVPLAMTLEFGNLTPVTDAQYVAFGQAFAESVQAYFQYVELANSTQANTGSAGTIVQTHLLSCANSQQALACASGSISQDSTQFVVASDSTQAASTTGAAVSQSHQVLAADSTQANAGAPASITQTHLAGVAGSAQANTASPSAIAQTHAVIAASSASANTSSTGSVSQSSTSFVLAANSIQVNAATAAAVRQTHLLAVASAAQAIAASTAAVMQTHLVSASSSAQPNAAGAAVVGQDSTHRVIAAAGNQANTCTAGSVLQTHALVAAPSAVDHIASASAIVQRHLVSATNSFSVNTASSGAAGLIFRKVPSERVFVVEGYRRQFIA